MLLPWVQRVLVHICGWTELPYPRTSPSLRGLARHIDWSWTTRERFHVEGQRFVLDTRLIWRVFEITWDHTLLSQAVALRPAPRRWPDVTQTIDDILSEVGRMYNGCNLDSIFATPQLPSDQRAPSIPWWYHAHQLAYALSAIPDLLHQVRSEWGVQRRVANSVLLSILHVFPKQFCLHPAVGMETVVSGTLVVQSLAKLHTGGIAPAEAFCKLVSVLGVEQTHFRGYL
ncbi:hypothetical protein C8Q74DRAFT_882960 [Fomes fomentarius]|nr:hypothetical protein C8Q74DRAFT_882960 [Fomes fomentarius]